MRTRISRVSIRTPLLLLVFLLADGVTLKGQMPAGDVDAVWVQMKETIRKWSPDARKLALDEIRKLENAKDAYVHLPCMGDALVEAWAKPRGLLRQWGRDGGNNPMELVNTKAGISVRVTCTPMLITDQLPKRNIPDSVPPGNSWRKEKTGPEWYKMTDTRTEKILRAGGLRGILTGRVTVEDYGAGHGTRLTEDSQHQYTHVEIRKADVDMGAFSVSYSQMFSTPPRKDYGKYTEYQTRDYKAKYEAPLACTVEEVETLCTDLAIFLMQATSRYHEMARSDTAATPQPAPQGVFYTVRCAAKGYKLQVIERNTGGYQPSGIHISGIVKDKNGKPIPRAQVKVPELHAGTFTDDNGSYMIDVEVKGVPGAGFTTAAFFVLEEEAAQTIPAAQPSHLEEREPLRP